MSKQLQTSTGGVLRDEHRVKDENGNWVTAVRLEAARTNSILDSEDFSSTNWTASVSVTTGNAVAPDGTTSADQVTDGSTSATQDVVQATTVSNDSNDRTASIHVKESTSAPICRLRLSYTGGSGSSAVYDLKVDPSDGSATASTNATRSGVVDWTESGDGFWRPWIVGPNNSTGNQTISLEFAPAATTVGTTAAVSSATTGSQDIWGAQLEGV